MIGRDARSPDPRATGYFERSAGCAAAPQSPLRWVVLAGALALLFTPVLPAVAAESPFSPGLFEALHNHTEAFEQDNLALWTPMLVGGIGSIRPDQGGEVRYGNEADQRAHIDFPGRRRCSACTGSFRRRDPGHRRDTESIAGASLPTSSLRSAADLTELDNGRDYGYAKFGVRSQIRVCTTLGI